MLLFDSSQEGFITFANAGGKELTCRLTPHNNVRDDQVVNMTSPISVPRTESPALVLVSFPSANTTISASAGESTGQQSMVDTHLDLISHTWDDGNHYYIFARGNVSLNITTPRGWTSFQGRGIPFGSITGNFHGRSVNGQFLSNPGQTGSPPGWANAGGTFIRVSERGTLPSTSFIDDNWIVGAGGPYDYEIFNDHITINGVSLPGSVRTDMFGSSALFESTRGNFLFPSRTFLSYVLQTPDKEIFAHHTLPNAYTANPRNLQIGATLAIREGANIRRLDNNVLLKPWPWIPNLYVTENNFIST